ncbi:EboA domain-containing protein [Agaribacter marinus]|uniref:Uncharacterized protein n=1 Tax=Agaribacter marinus TaxID=1431249 RepID=A0AA37WJ18_9ALTE|nr:EboA domain-containing protein [Agaribacter marinus]GLR71793.1 hypothetical protein GCM10007852_27010 [Agaribacter marinus]
MLNPVAKDMLPRVRIQLTTEENAWLSAGFDAIRSSNDAVNELLNISVGVKRKIKSAVSLDELPLCEASEIVRIILLIDTLLCHSNLPISQLVKDYYQYGDSQEKCALIKGLFLLDSEGLAVNTAVRASRCNSVDEFAALALHNPYPSTHFEVLNFNQLVLKALHQGLNIENVIGLQSRSNDVLNNMCFSYVIEQALAERIPPASIWSAIQVNALEAEHKAVFSQYARHFAARDEAHKQGLERLIESQAIEDVTI